MQLKPALALVYALCVVHGFSASPPMLGAPVVVDGHLQFTLTCESNAPYRIDASTNLQTWFPVATNFESGATRQIRVPMIGERAVYRALARTPLFNFALLARETIDSSGNSIVIDSFDSGDPNFSTDGEYDPLKRRDRGDVASNYQPTEPAVVIDFGNAKIYGKVLVNTNAWIDIGPNGKVGDLAWHAAPTHTGFQPGSIRDDLNVSVPQADAPFKVGVPPISGMYNGQFYIYMLISGHYSMSTLTLRSNQNMIVTANASLYVASQLSFSTSSTLVIAPGASLRLYTAATNVAFTSGVVSNSNPASAFAVFGLPRTTNISVSGSFKGCIYAPDAALWISGDENSFVGSVVARRINVNGIVGVHYDEALRRDGPFTW